MKSQYKIVSLVLALNVFPGWAEGFELTGLKEGLSWNLRNLTYYQTQKPSDAVAFSPAASDYPNQVVENDLRLDVNYSHGPLLIGLKPRAELFWQSWRDGLRANDSDTGGKLYFYEWLVRLNANNKLFAEYGLQNLQWGPSTLLSPSNPFDQRNGKDNIYKESVAGADYARMVWVPSSSWTVSAIANVDKGNKDYYRKYFNTYALKIDYQFQDGYVSLIGSYRDISNEPSIVDYPKTRVGYYAGYNLTDSLLSYVEGSLAKDDTEALIGASYTTDLGPTLGMEYYFNGGGEKTPANHDLLALAFNHREWRELFFGKNYLLLQAYQKNIFGSFDYVLRWIKNLDDQSNQFNIQTEYGLFDRLSLFGVASINTGSEGSELTAVRDYQIMAGVEYSF